MQNANDQITAQHKKSMHPKIPQPLPTQAEMLDEDTKDTQPAQTIKGRYMTSGDRRAHRLSLCKQRQKHICKTNFAHITRQNLRKTLSDLLVICRIPDDCIGFKRYPLFMARKAMAAFVAELKASRKYAT
jgi:hypothetical protein